MSTCSNWQSTKNGDDSERGQYLTSCSKLSSKIKHLKKNAVGTVEEHLHSQKVDKYSNRNESKMIWNDMQLLLSAQLFVASLIFTMTCNFKSPTSNTPTSDVRLGQCTCEAPSRGPSRGNSDIKDSWIMEPDGHPFTLPKFNMEPKNDAFQ